MQMEINCMAMDPQTEKKFFHLGLIGWPVEHSLSPRLHQAALLSAGLPGEYLLYPVENRPDWLERLAELVQNIRNGKIQGLNVTIPYKQSILPLLDDLSLAAQAIGAVNTIYLQGQTVIGDNTDAAGFMLDLEQLGFCPSTNQERKALVLGAGGAARAVVYALAENGWQVLISTRREEKARELIQRLPQYSRHLQAIPMDEVVNQSNLRLIVNTTPVGMSPDTHASPWPDGISLPQQASVYDLVYTPCETRFVREARSAGLRAENGLGMLIEQAARSFEIWTGCPADRKAMKKAVER
jgi:shikimate dehydrogenase